MQKIYKLSVGGLKKLIASEKDRIIKEAKGPFGPMGDVTKVAKKTKEVDACDLAATLEKDIDQMKAQKVHESKLLFQLKKLRESMRATRKRIDEKKKVGQ